MTKLLKLSLQFFGGEGTGAGASGAGSAGEGGGQATGVDATAAAEQRLRELGVPEGKAKQRASKYAAHMPTAEAKSAAEAVTATADVSTPTEEGKDTNVSTARMSWDEIKQDPEYKRAYDSEMQSMIKARLKADKPAKDALAAMTPAIELMARKYGLDSKNMDYAALAKAIENDDAYYEQKAMEMGTSVETAKRVDQLEREVERYKEAENITIQQQANRNHIMRLDQQAQAMKAMFPGFDLRTELQNPIFKRLVDPKVGLSVEDAYYAVHRKEIAAAQMQVAAQKTAEKISNAIQSGSRRPDESGASSQAPSVSTFDYRNASREQREAFKKRIREAAARGEKVYPGQ